MVDLETLGLDAGSCILSIGAVVFEPHTNIIGNKFYVNIDVQSQNNIGLKIDPDTQAWWSKQSKEARDRLLVDRKSIMEAISLFDKFWRQNMGVYFWSQGANFDGVLLTAVYKRLGITPPWRYYNCYDTRTAYWLSGFANESVKREGTHHNALDDAIYQVKCVQHSINKVKG
jgi:exodeoxyribonuclease VIII